MIALTTELHLAPDCMNALKYFADNIIYLFFNKYFTVLILTKILFVTKHSIKMVFHKVQMFSVEIQDDFDTDLSFITFYRAV